MREKIFKNGWFLFFLALFLVFLYPLLTLRQGFLGGDYGWQFYPWTQLYAEALKSGRGPVLWTPLIQSGFPLFAEGQTGMLYSLNLLFFRLLPFKIAYNGLFLSHFLMGGIFSYLFGRKRGMSPAAAALTALCFTFGSAYAGCFYNIVTMRTLVWFPLALYFVEVYLGDRKLWALFALSFVQTQSWLGGFAQTAAYSFLFIFLYYALRIAGDAALRKRAPLLHLKLAGSLGLSVLTALPQLWATLELAFHSSRILQEKTFILWGSAQPWSPVTLFLYPWSVFLRSNLYIGVLPFLLILLVRHRKNLKIWWILAAISFFFALGVFNPL